MPPPGPATFQSTLGFAEQGHLVAYLVPCHYMPLHISATFVETVPIHVRLPARTFQPSPGRSERIVAAAPGRKFCSHSILHYKGKHLDALVEDRSSRAHLEGPRQPFAFERLDPFSNL